MFENLFKTKADKLAEKRQLEEAAKRKKKKQLQEDAVIQPPAKKKSAGPGRTVVVSFGRFNPPTKGHQGLFDFIQSTAKNARADIRIYPSQSVDIRKNPLPFLNKLSFLRRLFPGLYFNDNKAIRTPIDAFMDVSNAGYRNVIVVVGSDRVADFQKMSQYLIPSDSPKYLKGKHIPINNYQVLAVPGERDADEEGVSGQSASKMRTYALAGDYRNFAQGVPTTNARIAQELYRQVRVHMGLQESNYGIKREALKVRTTLKETTLNQRPHEPKEPSQEDRLRVKQKTDLIHMKSRQNNELMAAKLRDVQNKSRKELQKLNEPDVKKDH